MPFGQAMEWLNAAAATAAKAASAAGLVETSDEEAPTEGGVALEPEPWITEDNAGEATPEKQGYGAGWGWGEALKGLEAAQQVASQVASQAAEVAGEVAKQAGVDGIVEAYKQDLNEFGSVLSSDAKIVANEVDTLAKDAKQTAEAVAQETRHTVGKAMDSVDAATGGVAGKRLRQLRTDTASFVSSVESELGLSEGTEATLTQLLRERGHSDAGSGKQTTVAPLKVDRFAEMVAILRADQATFAADPPSYAFVEWVEARGKEVRADGTRLPLTPREQEAKEDALTDEHVCRMRAELVPDMVTEEVFWVRFRNKPLICNVYSLNHIGAGSIPLPTSRVRGGREEASDAARGRGWRGWFWGSRCVGRRGRGPGCVE